MWRMLKAFAWMRFRMLANALEHSGGRDTLQRFSVAVDHLGPIIAAVLLIPSAVVLAGLGGVAGYTAAGGGRAISFEAARYLLLLVPLLVVIGPLVLPGADRTNPVRLLLLPIPRTTLYIAQSSSAFGDPWTILMVPLVLGIPAGLAAAGAFGAAVVALAAGVLLIAAIVGLSSVATSVLHLVARNRRRGELVALVFIVVLPVIGMIPGLLAGSAERGRPGEPLLPASVRAAAARALTLHPAQMFVDGVRSAVAGDAGRAGAAMAGLTFVTVALHGLGVVAFRKVLDSTGGSGARRGVAMRSGWSTRIPGLTSGASAVALGHFRLALRTPRGRSILLSPLMLLVLFGVLIYRGSGSVEFGPFHFTGGLSLAIFASAISLMSILPIAMNQFAVDGAGLTMTLLSPLSDRDLLAGKAAGNGLIVLGPLLLSLLAPLLLFRSGAPGVWLSLPLGLLAVYFVVAPVAAICSAIFPRAVNMNSIGRGSNAHGAAALLGMLSFMGAAVPPVVLVVLATRVFDRPVLAPVLVAAWCVAGYAIGRLLFRAALRTFGARRENLALLV